MMIFALFKRGVSQWQNTYHQLQATSRIILVYGNFPAFNWDAYDNYLEGAHSQ